MRTYKNLTEIKQANADLGHFFFSPSTLAFFNSRTLPGIIDGRYFVTSERFDSSTPRLYTVRRAEDDGSIDTVGEFMAYETPKHARNMARHEAGRVRRHADGDHTTCAAADCDTRAAELPHRAPAL